MENIKVTFELKADFAGIEVSADEVAGFVLQALRSALGYGDLERKVMLQSLSVSGGNTKGWEAKSTEDLWLVLDDVEPLSVVK